MGSLVFFGLLPAVYLLKRLISAYSVPAPLPPGPRGWPLVGNLFQWPTKFCWETFIEWGHIYGDIIHADILGVHIIILNSLDVAADMLNRKGAIYSDRPVSHFMGELVGWKDVMSHLNDGPQLREQRRLFAQTFGSRAALTAFEPTLEGHTRNCIREILQSPTLDRAMVTEYVRRLAERNILDVTYGHEVKDNHDELLNLALHVVDDSARNSTPGARLVEVLPWLTYLPSWIPGTRFKKEAMVIRQRWLNFVNKPFEYTRDQIFSKAARPSFVARNIEGQELTSEEEATVKWTSGIMFAAGSDTVYSTIASFFSFMAQHPEIQAKAQTEIDMVVGSDRLPAFSDRDQLPYVNAVINETLRYSPNGPIGLPHTCRTDDVYNGYFVPKGSLVFANIWAISRDSRHYKNPNVFDPMRFMGENPELDPREYVFGFGRRICPGRLFADDELYLLAVYALAILNISNAVNEQGAEITPTLELNGSISRVPAAFPCKVRARSTHAETLLTSDI